MSPKGTKQKIQKAKPDLANDTEEEVLIKFLAKVEKRKKKYIPREQARLISNAKARLYEIQWESVFQKIHELVHFVFPKDRAEFDCLYSELCDLAQTIGSSKKRIDAIAQEYNIILNKKKEIDNHYEALIRNISSKKHEIWQQQYKLERSFSHVALNFIGLNANNEQILHFNKETSRLNAEIEKLEQAQKHSIYEVQGVYCFENQKISASKFYSLAEELTNKHKKAIWRFGDLRGKVFRMLLSAEKRKEKHDKKQLEKEAMNDHAFKRIDAPLGVIRHLKQAQPLGSECPYCCEPLVDDRHADHIYPVSQGGRSNYKNLVYICPKCNLAKKDLTLNMYIDKFELDREAIMDRLKALGKNY